MRKQLWVGELWNDGHFARSVGDEAIADIIRGHTEYQTHEDNISSVTPISFSLKINAGVVRKSWSGIGHLA